jgi:dihydrofolate synthase/folylpolyglutamate synthase
MADFARSDSPAVQAQLDRLGSPTAAADRLGLGRIRELLDRLGRPQDSLPPVLHVAGTNGKGSTCSFLRAALEAAGHQVHVFTSPHLVRVNERIRVAGTLIEDEALAGLLNEVIEADAGLDSSFFEVTTAAAILAFARTRASACILEVGLGGRLDATNVIDRPLVCGIASLGLDHKQFLGSRLVDVAAEKAAIAKAGVPLITQLYSPPVAARVGQAAAAAGAPWLPRGEAWNAAVSRDTLRYHDAAGELSLPHPRLPGRHQAMNAALAIAILRHQSKLAVDDSAYAAALTNASWPARLQRLGAGPLTAEHSEVWLDGGHNPSAAREVAKFAKREFVDGKPLHLIFASLTSKEPKGTLAPFAGIASEIHTIPISDHDSRDPKELAALASTLGFAAQANSGLREAFGQIPEDARVLIFGSLYVAGEVLAANQQLPD